jgi:sporulation protein YlmC with PRC-barrel domain
MNKPILAWLLGTALVSAPAFAQTATSPAPASPPAGQSTAAQPARSGQFMNTLQKGQWRASKLIGVDIYGFDGANRNDRDKIGDVNELVVDQNGNIQAVVIGVGGFLGMGEKDVAIPFKSVEWRYGDEDRQTMASTSGARTDTAAPARTDPPATGTTAPARTDPPATGTTAPRPADRPAATAERTDKTDRMTQGYPDRGYIRMSKADLQNAPAFRYDPDDARRDAERRTDRPAPTAPANPTAPRQ